nr:STAS domain-containing protein [Saprospiraceae bacterium]
MKYELEKEEKYTILRFNEENLNSTLAPKLKSEFIFLLNEGVNNLILDLSKVKYIDSSGLSSILTAHRLLKQGGSFVVTGLKNDHVRKIIQISRLDTILNIIPTIEESIEFVLMEEVERELLGEAEEE